MCANTILETMIRGLTKLSWERVDISFKGSRQRLMAHSTIQASILLYLDHFIRISKFNGISASDYALTMLICVDVFTVFHYTYSG